MTRTEKSTLGIGEGGGKACADEDAGEEVADGKEEHGEGGSAGANLKNYQIVVHLLNG